MLVITRKSGSDLMLEIPGHARPVTIRICRVAGSRVTLGIEAEPEIRVRRPEQTSKNSTR